MTKKSLGGQVTKYKQTGIKIAAAKTKEPRKNVCGNEQRRQADTRTNHTDGVTTAKNTKKKRKDIFFSEKPNDQITEYSKGNTFVRLMFRSFGNTML